MTTAWRVLVYGIILAIVAGFWIYTFRMDRACTAGGGVYVRVFSLWHPYQCMKPDDVTPGTSL